MIYKVIKVSNWIQDLKGNVRLITEDGLDVHKALVRAKVDILLKFLLMSICISSPALLAGTIIYGLIQLYEYCQTPGPVIFGGILGVACFMIYCGYMFSEKIFHKTIQFLRSSIIWRNDIEQAINLFLIDNRDSLTQFKMSMQITQAKQRADLDAQLISMVNSYKNTIEQVELSTSQLNKT